MTKTVKFFVDPLCAWCWAQKPTMEKIMGDIDGKANIEFYMGGMRVRGNIKKIEGEYKSYLTQVFDRVNQASGQIMNKKVLETEGLYFDSEFPCRAVILIRHILGTDQAIQYLHKIQTAYFVEAKNITKPEMLAELAADGFVEDGAAFLTELTSAENEKYSFEEFSYVQTQQVRGFPAVHFIDKGNVVGGLPGFVPYDQAKVAVQNFIG